MTPTNPPIRKPRTKKVTDEIAVIKAQLEALTRERDALKATIANQDTLIAQLVKDTQLDAALIDEMANQIRSSQVSVALPRNVEFLWLTQSSAKRDAANAELAKLLAEGWHILKLDHEMLYRDVTLWKPSKSITPTPLTRSARRTVPASIMATPAPAMRVPVQPGISITRAVVVNHYEGDPEDFDAQQFNRDSDLRMAQSALNAYRQFERSPFFRPLV